MSRFIFLICLTCVSPHVWAQSTSPTMLDKPSKQVGPKVGDQAPEFELKKLNGSKVKLAELQEKGPVVLVVLRGYPGYQCPLCNEQVAKLVASAEAFHSKNAQVVLVYPGPEKALQQKAQEFLDADALPSNFHFVLDPAYRFVTNYGLRWNAPNETAYPSTFIVDHAGKIIFAKISNNHGERAEPDQILQAIPKP